MLKAVIISDTHAGTIKKLGSALISRIKASDVVIHAGDADTEDFMSELGKISKSLCAVRGNCDWGSDLPPKAVFCMEDIRIGLSHGTGSYANIVDRLSYLFSDDDVKIIIFGHTHVPMDEDIDGVRFINPGSTSLNRSLKYGTFAELTVEGSAFTSRIIGIDDTEGDGIL